MSAAQSRQPPRLSPRTRLALGLGCDRGTPVETLETALAEALAACGGQPEQVGAVASIDLKADEAGLLELARRRGWTIRFYPAATLAQVAVPNPSETVRKYTGTPSVSEAAALQVGGVAMDQLLIEKHKHRGPDGRNATISIARMPPMSETQPSPSTPAGFVPGGKIMLVGLGPGSHDHLTARARGAIAEADTVIGYVTYIRLVAELLEGKEVIKKSMTEELDRAIEALDRARQGRKVALVSSGDAGVYGMAGPTFEVLFQAGWTPDCGIEVEIVPGASALNTCAALVGAPLTHDFCAISLSDLLTPWPTIARRLDAVAMADFVVALYNPKSGRRTRQILEAQRLFLRHRAPDTPVAIVKSAYRPKQRVEFTTLAQMAEADIGMLSTVLIGNSNTFIRHGLMVTPRGYANKYQVADGERATRDGEKAGRSLSTGLDGWLAEIHASGLSAAELAKLHKLPEDYLAALLAEGLPGEESPAAEEADA
jgi:precorrin-3B C17-methyltransferase